MMTTTVAWLALLCLTGCASYTDRVKDAQRAVVNGHPERAVELLNEELDTDSVEELPTNFDGERALLLLERATLLQAMGDYRTASRDMILVDDRMEWVDLQSGSAASVLRFLYSDDVGVYRPPPHERLLLHTMNLINFMAASELSSARVEARRFHILQDYFLDEESRKVLPVILGLGNYLAGAAFEASHDYDEAVRFYTRAHLYGTWPETDDTRLLDLLALTDYKGFDLGDLQGRANLLIDRVKSRERPDRRTYQQRHQTGDTLVVVQTGLVPYRRAERVPLVTALQYSSRSSHSGIYLSTSDRNQAMHLYRRGVVTWINAPVLTKQGLPPRRTVTLEVDSRSMRLTHPISIADQVEKGWEVIGATAMAAAISRAVTRAVAGESTRMVTDAVAQQQGATVLVAGVLSWLISFAVEGSMAAADTPDTRSWTSLPADVHLVRMKLPAGSHQLDIKHGGRTDTRQLEVESNRFQLVNFSRLR